MNVGYTEQKVIRTFGTSKLIAEYEANHYFHRCSDGRIFNEKQGYYIKHYVMENAEGQRHTLAAQVEDRKGGINVITDKARLMAHWAGFSGETETFRMPRSSFKRTYFID